MVGSFSVNALKKRLMVMSLVSSCVIGSAQSKPEQAAANTGNVQLEHLDVTQVDRLGRFLASLGMRVVQVSQCFAILSI
jgi:hypothetical protein